MKLFRAGMRRSGLGFGIKSYSFLITTITAAACIRKTWAARIDLPLIVSYSAPRGWVQESQIFSFIAQFMQKTNNSKKYFLLSKNVF
jgi:hypothetical protein